MSVEERIGTSCRPSAAGDKIDFSLAVVPA